MIDFHKYLMRHGECWISEILNGVERQRGIRFDTSVSLEERWDFIMNDIQPAQSQQLAA